MTSLTDVMKSKGGVGGWVGGSKRDPRSCQVRDVSVLSLEAEDRSRTCELNLR